MLNPFDPEREPGSYDTLLMSRNEVLPLDEDKDRNEDARLKWDLHFSRVYRLSILSSVKKAR